MDDLWHLKACEGLNRSYRQSSPASSSVIQVPCKNSRSSQQRKIETLSEPFGHPIVQQEVCVIERTIRQESVRANLLNCGMQNPNIQFIRGDTENSLRALMPGSQHEVCSSYQSVITAQSPVLSSSPQEYHMGSIDTPWIGSWPAHPSNMSGGNRVGGGSSGPVMDSSLNLPGREVTSSMLGRKVNMSQYSRMIADQDCLEPSPTRTSAVDSSKQIDDSNDISGQGAYPHWWTEIIRSRQREQNIASATFPSGSSFPNTRASSRDFSSANSSPTAFAPISLREARVVCVNYDTGQRIGGELYLTQLGLLGVICSCHGSNMSVAKFTQHAGVYSTNPGNVVAMDGTGESLVHWRRTLFTLYGIRVPYDNQGWNWSEGSVSESGPSKFKAGVIQGWQKEVDFSYSAKPFVKGRLTQVWDVSGSSKSAANDLFRQDSASLALSSNLGEGCLRRSKEEFLKSLEKAFRGNSLEGGSYPSNVEDTGVNVRRCSGLPDMLSYRNSSAEFINFINGSHQFVAGHAEHQVAAEHEIAVGSRSLLRGLDLSWTERRECLRQEKDKSLSSFELKLGQPSQQPVLPPICSSANQMPRVPQRGLDTGGQQNTQNTSATSAAGFHMLSSFEEPSNDRLFSQPSFENTTYLEPNLHSFCGAYPNRGMEGNASVLVDPSPVKDPEDVSTLLVVENVRERENRLKGNGDHCPAGMRSRSSFGYMRSSLKSPVGSEITSEHSARQSVDEAQLHLSGGARLVAQGHQDLDTTLVQEWMSKSRPSESQATEFSGTIAGRGSHEGCGESMIHTQRLPVCEEAGNEGEKPYSCGDMGTSRKTTEGQGCKYLSLAKATATIMKGRMRSKVDEDADVCMKEANQERNEAEAGRHRLQVTTSERQVTQGCSSPQGSRLRCFQDTDAEAPCFGKNSSQGEKANFVGANSHSPSFVAGTDVGVTVKVLNHDGSKAKAGSMECKRDTFQWKEMGGNLTSGKDAIQDEMSPRSRSLAEGLLADAVANVNSRVAVSSKVSDNQQALPEIYSKSFETLMSGFSDGVGAENCVSNAHSSDRISVGSRMADEASRVGKCSSSSGVDIGRTPTIRMSSKGNHTLNSGSPSSQEYSSLCIGTEGSRTMVKTRLRGSHAVKGLAAKQIVDGVLVDPGNVEKKTRKTMKWKWLDAAEGTPGAKKQKISLPGNMAETFDPSQKLVEVSFISNCLRHKRMFEFSPSPCGEIGATAQDEETATQDYLAAPNLPKGMEVNAVSSTNSLKADEGHLTTRETLVIRFPQTLDRKKAKRSGRSKTSNIEMLASQNDMTCNKPALSDIITQNSSPVDDNSMVKKIPGSRGLVPKLTVSAIKSLPRRCSIPHTQSGKLGRVTLRRPSPRNAIRMVSLNDIMSKPGSVACLTPRDDVGASVVEDGLVLSRHEDCCEASAIEVHPKSCASNNVMKASAVKDGLQSFFCKDSVRISAVKDGLQSISCKDSVRIPAVKEDLKLLPRSGVEILSPGESLKRSAMESTIKLDSSEDGIGICFPKGDLNVCPGKDGLKVSSTRQVPEIRSWKTGPKEFLRKNGGKVLTSDVGCKGFCPRSLDESGQVASALKDKTEEPISKSVVRIPVATDSVEVAALRACSKAAATTNCPTTLATRIGTRLSVKDCLKSASRKEGWEASGATNGLGKATWKDELQILASRDALKDSCSIDVGSVAKDMSDLLAWKDAPRFLVPMDSSKSPSSAKTGGKGFREPNPSLPITAASHDDYDKLSSHQGNSWTVSKNSRRAQRPEARKLRSLYELISENNLTDTGSGAFDFHGDGMESSVIPKEDVVSRSTVQLNPTYSVPVHLTVSKRLVPRDETLLRGRLAKSTKPLFQRHKAGRRNGGNLGAEPLEFSIRQRVGQDMALDVGTPRTSEDEMFTNARLRPVTPRIWSAQKNMTKYEINDGTSSSGPVASGLVKVKELLSKGLMDYNSDQSYEKFVDPEILENALKRQKVLEPSRPSQLNSSILRKRNLLPLSRPITPTTPSIDVVGSKIKDIKTRPLRIEDDLNSPERKKSSQRHRWFDRQGPKGVVECCVCGSSISEFFNQIVCCSRCPVKVHQACYGVKKIPNSAWCCRTCKATAIHPICVLCGYGGGAMTRAQKAVGFLKGLVKVWEEKFNSEERAGISSPHSLAFLEIGMLVDNSIADHPHLPHELTSYFVRGKAKMDLSEMDSNYRGGIQRLGQLVFTEKLMACNTVLSGLLDSAVVQWVHMVCALWMPGTRCLNFGTMGVFDVSGVSQPRRKLVCSICNRKGGACVQCRVVKCGIPFHAWCAHKKGLLQSEVVEDGSDQVGFFGKCLRHGKGGDFLNDSPDLTEKVPEGLGFLNGGSSSCARTKGYAGKLTLEQKALLRRQATRSGSAVVSPEQVAAWLRINERKSCSSRRLLKSANSDQKTDHREYLRFKQDQGWRRLSVYKSGIHALGLYTAEFIGRGGMVVEYIGEIVGLRVADKREADYHSGKRMQYQGACYLFRIDRERIIDATRKGGIARFVNHSCSPNCVAKVIYLKNQSKVVFFAQRDIYAGEEITYDYQFNFEQEGDKIPCFCGSANCRGTLN